MSRAGLPNYAGRHVAMPGYSPSEAEVLAEQRELDAAGVANRTPLSTMFPVYRPIPIGFNQIPVPAGLVMPATGSAMYGLRSFHFKQDSGVGMLLAGAYGQLVSPDVSGAGISGQVAAAGGAGTALPWGDRTGSSACILIGKKLGITVGSWQSSKVYVPGIELSTAAGPPADTKILPALADSYPLAINFPPGSWSDTTPSLLPVERNTLPMIMRFTEGDTLDAALVVSSATVNNLANARVICGRAFLTLSMLPLEWLDVAR